MELMKGLTLQRELLRLTAIKMSKKKSLKYDFGISEGDDDGVHTSWKFECIFLCPSECKDRCVWRWVWVSPIHRRFVPKVKPNAAGITVWFHV